jgi:hypothetical protein
MYNAQGAAGSTVEVERAFVEVRKETAQRSNPSLNNCLLGLRRGGLPTRKWNGKGASFVHHGGRMTARSRHETHSWLETRVVGAVASEFDATTAFVWKSNHRTISEATATKGAIPSL